MLKLTKWNLALLVVRVILERWSWNGHLLVILGRNSLIFIVQVTWETELQVNMNVLVRRWSWKGCWSVTLGKSHFCAGVAKVSERQSFKPFSKVTEFQVNMIILMGRWSWKCCLWMTLGKTWLICSGLGKTELWAILPRDRASSHSPRRQSLKSMR